MFLDATTDGSTATTAFGPVPLRHALGAAAPTPGRVSVLLREGQLALVSGTPNAVIAHVEGEGQWDRVTFLNDRGYGTAVTARLLRRPGSALVTGSEVRIGIGGTGYVLPVGRTRRDYRAALRVMWRVHATSPPSARAAVRRVRFGR